MVTRIHSPEEYGDMLPRPVYVQALKEGNLVSALDAGRNGRLALRMVEPIFSGQTLVGYVQVGMDISGMVRTVGMAEGIDLAFMLDKKRLTVEYLHQARGGQHTPFWVESDTVAIYTSMANMDSALAEKLRSYVEDEANRGEDGEFVRLNFVHRQNYYVANALSLTDSEGHPLGELFIIENATVLLGEYALNALLLLLAGLVVIALGGRAIGTGLDRTDRRLRAMMDRVIKAEQTFEGVFNQSETAFVLQSRAQGAVVTANARALELFGVDSAADIDLTRLCPVPPGSALYRAWRDTGSTDTVLELQSPKGPAYCIAESFSIGNDPDLQCLAIRNVSSSIRFKMESLGHTEFLQRIIDELPSAVCIKDEDLRITMYNAAFAKIFSQEEDLVGNVRHSVLPDAVMDKILEEDRKVFDSGAVVSLEVDVPRLDGEPYNLLVSKRVIQGRQGEPCLLAVCTDIGALKQGERKLMALNEQAQAAIVAKSEFLACMSHEMRTPLNVILGMTQLAQAARPSPALARQLAKIGEAAAGLLENISQILDFANAESGRTVLERKPFFLNDLLDDLSRNAASLPLRPGVRFEMLAERFPDPFLGDARRLGQVLRNLLSNAAKFTHEGSVCLHCRLEGESEGRSLVYFAVEDSGIGIPEERIERLFTGFEQLEGGHSRTYGGFGLGLAINRHLIHLMKGKIGLNSKEGKGSTFFFTLPLEHAAPDAVLDNGGRGKTSDLSEQKISNEKDKNAWTLHAAVPSDNIATDRAGREKEPDKAEDDDAGKAHSGRYRVLIVEDNPVNQEILGDVLGSFGLDVALADNGEEALARLEEENFDLVFMDVQMPVMDGLAATRAIRAGAKEPVRSIPVIALTANAMPKDRQDCAEAGMNDFLSKPLDIVLLKEKVEHWLGPVSEESWAVLS
ncbi:response regulator [Desulfovibrio sp. OttesenSCG-928-F20]|nr:response regulator [Desulfovibrio sp. OttesenSCG-928-F20]